MPSRINAAARFWKYEQSGLPPRRIPSVLWWVSREVNLSLEPEDCAMKLIPTRRCYSLHDTHYPRFLSTGEQKWSKGKVREKVANQVLFNEDTYNRCLSEVPKVSYALLPWECRPVCE